MNSARPNVVLVVADDLGIGDIGAYGGRVIRTPAIDRLAATGVACEAMYAAAATDTPSRAGLLVGRFGARYGLPASLRPGMTDGLPSGVPTVASLLRWAGYATGLFGQWRLGSQPDQHPLDHGFDQFAGTLYGTDVAPLDWYEGTTVSEPSFDPALAAGRITDDAMQFIDDHHDRPFLAILSHLATHAPFRAEPDFAGRSRAGAYGDVVEQIDHHLGRLLQHLDRSWLSPDTLVIFTSDNGPRYEGDNQARRGRKPEVFDGGVRVPFVAAQLTVTQRVRDAVPRSLLDLMPSLCALAGAEPPADLDGEDMSALLAGGAPPDRGPVYLFFNQFLNAVRSDKWKFHVAFRNDQRPPSNRPWSYLPQLFDVEADWRETYNVAVRHPDVVDGLREPLETLRDEVAAEAQGVPPLDSFGPVQSPYRTFSSTEAHFGQKDERFVIVANGSTLWMDSDEYGAIYLDDAAGPSVTATTEVVFQEDTNEAARAGIMIKNDVTQAGSSPGYVLVAITARRGFVMNWDANGNGFLDSTQRADVSQYPAWLRLVREGSQVTGFYSLDGQTWESIATVQLTSPTEVQDIGIFATALNPTQSSRADFATFHVEETDA